MENHCCTIRRSSHGFHRRGRHRSCPFAPVLLDSGNFTASTAVFGICPCPPLDADGRMAPISCPPAGSNCRNEWPYQPALYHPVGSWKELLANLRIPRLCSHFQSIFVSPDRALPLWFRKGGRGAGPRPCITEVSAYHPSSLLFILVPLAVAAGGITKDSLALTQRTAPTLERLVTSPMCSPRF